ncbi:GntR family transcriptional regulator [Bosea sp. (in: a-proteobacteria)]|uniref:GntR family transcriptional regulator n=1 Tax=Bosea sp. (in: a-proteobacteria) TaxID=1871050 RepID=UPI002625A9CD|nr:GntR family transcriptional regulator [Bosea sp. (in: a-proteobacteria)]MCO5090995.1 GntR family transcriptional regulator [Bosea sp. (in: a-proteobacteria)]
MSPANVIPIRVREPTEMGQLIGEPGETLTETLRRTLLEMIVFGYFERGLRLYPERLAEQFGVSLTPVREALMRLAAEGYIEAVQRRGFHVRAPDAKQVVDLWQVRLGLELTAGELLIERLASGTLPAAALTVLDDLMAALEQSPRTIAHRPKLGLNAEFHHRIVELSGNDILTSLYRGIQMQLIGEWVQRGLQSWRVRLSSEAAEHRAIVAALRAMDRDAYAAAARHHIARSLKDALADLAERDAAGAQKNG